MYPYKRESGCKKMYIQSLSLLLEKKGRKCYNSNIMKEQ